MIEEAKGGIGCAGVGGDGQLDARAGAGDTLPPVLPPPGPPDACPPRRLPAARRIPPRRARGGLRPPAPRGCRGQADMRPRGALGPGRQLCDGRPRRARSRCRRPQ